MENGFAKADASQLQAADMDAIYDGARIRVSRGNSPNKSR